MDRSSGNNFLLQKVRSLLTYDHNIHVMTGRDALIEKLRMNDVTVLLGETGSGKTTRECNLTVLSIYT